MMEALADARADTTAMVRVAAKAADLPGTPRHVVATLDEPPPVRVLQEFDRIFLLSPEIEEQAALETVFIDAVAAAGHRPHIVKVCADGFQDAGCDVRFMRAHRQVALHLEAVGLPVTYLAAATYMEDLLDEAAEIRQTAEIRAPAGDGRAGFVAVADVATAAARVLTTGGHQGATYVLTGPEALGYAKVRNILPGNRINLWPIELNTLCLFVHAQPNRRPHARTAPHIEPGNRARLGKAQMLCCDACYRYGKRGDCRNQNMPKRIVRHVGGIRSGRLAGFRRLG